METENNTQFIDTLTNDKLLELVKRLLSIGASTNLYLRRAESIKSTLAIEVYTTSNTGSEYLGTLFMTDSKALHYQRFNGEDYQDFSSKLISFMCEQENGNSYAKMLHEQGQKRIDEDYQRHIEIFNTFNPNIAK